VVVEPAPTRTAVLSHCGISSVEGKKGTMGPATMAIGRPPSAPPGSTVRLGCESVRPQPGAASELPGRHHGGQRADDRVGDPAGREPPLQPGPPAVQPDAGQ